MNVIYPIDITTASASVGNVQEYDISLPNQSGYVWKVVGGVVSSRLASPMLVEAAQFQVQVAVTELTTTGLDNAWRGGLSQPPILASATTQGASTSGGAQLATNVEIVASTVPFGEVALVSPNGTDKYARGGVKVVILSEVLAVNGVVPSATQSEVWGYLVLEEVKLTSGIQGALLEQGNSLYDGGVLATQVWP